MFVHLEFLSDIENPILRSAMIMDAWRKQPAEELSPKPTIQKRNHLPLFEERQPNSDNVAVKDDFQTEPSESIVPRYSLYMKNIW